MTSMLSTEVNTFLGLKVLVIGEAMLDRYLMGTSDRLSQEAPVPVVQVRDRQDVPGGAANAAVNVKSLGGEPLFLSVIGTDPEGGALRQALERQGVSTQFLILHPTRPTLAKNRVMANSQMLVRFDQGQPDRLDESTEQALIDRLHLLFDQCDAVLVSDYNYGILTPKILQTLAELQQQSPHIVVVDSRNLRAYRSIGITAIKPNYREATQLLGVPPLEQSGDRVAQMTELGESLLQQTGAAIAAVTLDVDGALILQRDASPYRTFAKPAPQSQTTGAGDTYISAFTLGLAARLSVSVVADLAAAAAAIVVAKPGTSTCHHQELQKALMASRSPNLTEYLTRFSSYRRHFSILQRERP